ncbi:YEATS domain-containing protein 4 [Galdieria sulphuraria]|uniref:YEATS domain-containing protein 4 n=1 Tax=Galdieria sulphuraria TaxID=130081 RepID=M2VTK6_GALSU|nr:YEATS domain-containing protein 4 [Galdieria sulphuraria]EME26536.1 YEATS domain-containing protein 4 [Galdieria sulphuraria]|eukprot:XP_005703056.1 YEATS domain-containing protein 4 [Galdieria sulphuraria]
MKASSSPKARTKGATVAVPVIQGSIAFWLGPEADEWHSHRWTAYIRGPKNEDLSYFIRYVEFHLHESFHPSKRVVTRPPFELTETGWGEFDLIIRLFFIDNLESPIELVHPLRLFPNPPKDQSVEEPVVNEYYEELVFQDPPEELLAILRMGPQRTVETELQKYFLDFTRQEAQDLEKIKHAKDMIRTKLLAINERSKEIDEERKQLEEEISRIGKAV